METILFAIERTMVLLGCYRSVSVDDADAFVGAVVTVLSKYPPDIVRVVTDPVIGIAGSPKFKRFVPNSGEIKSFCDAQLESLQWEEKLRAILQRRGCVLVLETSPRFAAMQARLKRELGAGWADRKSRGAWVPKGWLLEPA